MTHNHCRQAAALFGALAIGLSLCACASDTVRTTAGPAAVPASVDN